MLNSGKKVKILQKSLEQKEIENEQLRLEVARYKRIIPDDTTEVQSLITKYQDAIAEAYAVKERYENALKDVEKLKRHYRRDMDKLIKDVKRGK